MTPASILDIIATNIRQIVPGLEQVNISREDMLSPLGLDSVGRAELIEKTLEDLDLRVSRFDFHSAANLGQLADLLYQKLEGAQL
ncbi:acyl carrier protein [Chitinophaga nivalis]|uniref:Acyl carrier protein n=1 Tax=Chitinophaga nivalis TaxID=2991709 RepID=A0ABT3IKF7_9BACT|nr:acyl carrier protein [Chitinophaga nivalis]MCW3465908.1 acyl carrier protein [Chitinophaga nivalis]MCW3484401.1 acyl carrier protein [Chitinophaga nivalis]